MVRRNATARYVTELHIFHFFQCDVLWKGPLKQRILDFLSAQIMSRTLKIKYCFLISSNNRSKFGIKIRHLLSNTGVYFENGVAYKETQTK